MAAIRLFLNLEFGMNWGMVPTILNFKGLREGKHRKRVPRVKTF